MNFPTGASKINGCFCLMLCIYCLYFCVSTITEMLSSANRNYFLFHTDDDTFSNVFCESSGKLINVHLFALAAQYYSFSNLGVCTPLEDVLEALRGDNQGTTGIFTFVYKFLFFTIGPSEFWFWRVLCVFVCFPLHASHFNFRVFLDSFFIAFV